MGKFEPYSRRQLRLRRSQWLKRNRRPVVYTVTGIAGMIGISTAVITVVLAGAVQWYLIGLSHAGLLAAGLHLLNSGFLAADREALWHVRGAWGEENTRGELHRAKRRRLVWGWVDSISLQAGDLDHVVLTRRGGVLVIDSKWRNQVTTLDLNEMARSARRARSRADGVVQTVLSRTAGRDRNGGRARDRGRRRATSRSIVVMPVVVMWGAAQQTMPDATTIDEVTFVPGRNLLCWLKTLGDDPVTGTAARHALKNLRAFRSTSAPQP